MKVLKALDRKPPGARGVALSDFGSLLVSPFPLQCFLQPSEARIGLHRSLLATLTKATANMASALTIAAFEASAADASSATNPAFPPDLAPSDADTDHSDDAAF